jgi:glycosyltransferase involved in cell wall biosynthesis
MTSRPDGSRIVGPGTRPLALWVLPVSDLAGVARHVIDVTEMRVPGWRIVVALPPGPLADRLRDRGVAVVEAAIGPDYGTSASIREIRQLLRALQPRLVHSHLSFADIVVAIASVRSPAAVVTTEHGISPVPGLYQGGPIDDVAMRVSHHWRLRQTDLALAVSHATARAIRERWRPPSRLPIRVVHNGIDTDALPRARPTTGLRIAAVSRLAPEKNLEHVIGAFARLRRAHTNAELVIAGDGPLRHALEGHALSQGVAHCTQFIGHVEPGPLLGSVDVIVQLSTWENCSYTLLDAVRNKKGVVATRVGGNDELLPDPCLVPLGDVTGTAERMAEQGLFPDRRPSLPAGWPTIAQMCQAIADAYTKALAGGMN